VTGRWRGSKREGSHEEEFAGEVLIRSFPTEDPEGRLVWSDIYELVNSQRGPHDTFAGPRGLTRLMTKGGEHVNRLGKGVYRVVDTRVILRSDEPEAL
jgi:hypothetical protein